MNKLLTLYEFGKLATMIEGICLFVLVVLYAVTVRVEEFTIFGIDIGALFVSFVIAFFFTSKAERVLQDGEVKLWSTKRIAIYLFFPTACALAGLITMVVYVNINIAILMVVLLTIYFGTSLGRLVKIVFRRSTVRQL